MDHKFGTRLHSVARPFLHDIKAWGERWQVSCLLSVHEGGLGAAEEAGGAEKGRTVPHTSSLLSKGVCTVCYQQPMCVPAAMDQHRVLWPTHPYHSMVPGDSPALKSAYADCCSPLLLGAEHLHSLL